MTQELYVQRLLILYKEALQEIAKLKSQQASALSLVKLVRVIHTKPTRGGIFNDD